MKGFLQRIGAEEGLGKGEKKNSSNYTREGHKRAFRNYGRHPGNLRVVATKVCHDLRGPESSSSREDKLKKIQTRQRDGDLMGIGERAKPEGEEDGGQIDLRGLRRKKKRGWGTSLAFEGTGKEGGKGSGQGPSKGGGNCSTDWV